MSIPRAVVEELSVLAGRVTALEARVAELEVGVADLRAAVRPTVVTRKWLQVAPYRSAYVGAIERLAALFGELSCDDEIND